MRLKTLFLLFGLILCTTALVNCSRESSIKENVNLRNNHSVVFVYKTPFENPDAFADSIINLPNPDSVIVSDTVTVTIGDTIHMMGFLRYNSDKIYLYQWILDSLVRDTSGKGKDKMKKALVTGHNATPQSWVYMKEGVYSPLFVAVDGNSATDTAGKDQFIRVINTPPYLGVPKDTLWTRAKSPISFPILALDSFGTITSFKVDVDASGKRDAKDWKYTKSESSDSLIITIPYDSTLTDSLGNQKIYIIVTDDDKNTTKDSVLLHFNQLPTIKILGPDDQQRISDTVESFRLFYEGHDRDNEDQLRYYVRVAATPDNQDDDLNLSNVYDLVLKNSASTSFAVIENGENALKNLGFTGRYFSWDVWVTDGYDTVVVEKIKTSKGKRPRFFYLGPGKSTCDFIGIAKFEGLSAHSGIKITLVNTADTNNIYTASTNSKGEFRVSDLPAGTFKLIAEDETGRGFVKVTTRTPNINAGDEKELPPILLKDPAPPRIYNIKGFEDTLAVRAWTVSGRFSDYGSQVKTAVAMLGKDTCGSKNSPCKFSNLTSYAWSVDMSGLSDGNYSFKITATDSAGYHSDTTFTFVVSATNISITVNNASSAMVGDAGTLTFKANVAEAKPAVSEVTWKTNVPGDSPRTISVSEGVAQIQLQKKHFPNAEANTRYTMQAIADNGAVSNIVRFGFYSDGPMVNIDAPAYDTTITLNDEIALSTTAIGNNSDATNDYTLTWICVESSTATENCFAANNLTPTKAWTTAGVKRIIAKVTNNDSKTATDTLQINVITDPPSIKVDDNDGVISRKVNAKYKFEYTAKDKYGTIQEVAWKCGNGSFNTTVISPAKKEHTDSMEIQLPNTEATNYKCIVRATDDDNQIGFDTLKFNIIKDIPVIRLNIHNKNVTIKDQEQLKYTASNTLGGTIYVDYICGGNLNNLKVSNWSSSWQGRKGETPSVVMPESAGNYYCVMRAVDEDEKDMVASAATLYSLDTVTYKVFRAPPSVTLNESYTRTIKDTLTLYANAKDSSEATLPGRIVSYEWGCGPNSDHDILSKLTNTGKNTYLVTLPNTPQNNYLCIVQVTDDDGLTARDTTQFTVELAPPTVTVSRKTGTIRAGFDIILNATASDSYEGSWGYIAKREWSCGANATDINNNWKTVSTYDTTWKAPSASVNYYCVARATDDDGNIATDTMTLTYSTEQPVISVAETQIYVVQGDVFFLNATINNVWQGINWYSWQCFYNDTKQAAENLRKLDYYKNGERFYDYRETLSAQGRDLYCVVSAEEKATKAVFRDTSRVKVLTVENDLPVGKITAVDTIYPWSGDEAQSGEAIYFNSPEWSGSQSVIGTIGNENTRDYYWQFSNVSSTFYHGNADGSIDTSSAELNQAFRRPINEGSFSICLDFRDSISATDPLHPSAAFLRRHQAETTCRTVYVRRAWKNLAAANDTVLEKTTVRTPPAITTVGNNLSVVYLTAAQTVASRNYNGTGWTNLSTAAISVDDSITALRMASNGNDLFLAVLTKGNTLKVYKSNAGTSPWASFGNAITSVTSINLTCHPTSGNPVVAYVKSNYPYFSYWKNNAWESKQISTSKTSREVNAIFSNDGVLLTTFTDNTSWYNTYYAIYNGNTNNYNVAKGETLISREMSAISLATEGSTVYMGYLNRSSVVGAAGPYVKKGTLSGSTLNWTAERNLQEGMLPSNIKVAARNGKVYAVIDDNGRGLSHCHAYFFDGSQWRPYGENQLPYFKGPFYSSHGYNLYGFSPNIAIANNGMVYISMIAWPNVGAASQNNGPIFMKNISESWTFNTKP
ncbi:MAG: carboxypeptidase regulatory-like domain-containing protein [Fibrobacter sp.]|nr:carboxypeptidase regulatory-like domain-containing protein [Fibrobacter sp.]